MHSHRGGNLAQGADRALEAGQSASVSIACIESGACIDNCAWADAQASASACSASQAGAERVRPKNTGTTTADSLGSSLILGVSRLASRSFADFFRTYGAVGRVIADEMYRLHVSRVGVGRDDGSGHRPFRILNPPAPARARDGRSARSPARRRPRSSAS